MRRIFIPRSVGRSNLHDGAVVTHRVRNLPRGRIVAVFYFRDSNGHIIKRDPSIRVKR